MNSTAFEEPCLVHDCRNRAKIHLVKSGTPVSLSGGRPAPVQAIGSSVLTFFIEQFERNWITGLKITFYDARWTVLSSQRTV
jgi:hypothetical protein